RLHEWLHDDSELIDWKQRTGESRDRWREGDRDPGHLLRGSVLARGEEVLARHPAQTSFLRDFVGESRRLQDEERRARTEMEGRRDALGLAAEAERAGIATASGLATSLCLGVCSVERMPTFEGDLAVRQALALAALPHCRVPHNGRVLAVAFSPDGTRVATG